MISVIPREVYYPHRMLQFVARQLYGMNQTEKYLEAEFGDYMTLPSEDERVTHGGLVNLENDNSVYIQKADCSV